MKSNIALLIKTLLRGSLIGRQKNSTYLNEEKDHGYHRYFRPYYINAI